MSDEIQTSGDFAVGSSLLDYMVQVNEIVMELAGAITQLQLCRKHWRMGHTHLLRT